MKTLWTVILAGAVLTAAGCQSAPSKFDRMSYEMDQAHFGFKVVKVVNSSTFVIDWSGTGDPKFFIRIGLVGVKAPDAVDFKELGGRRAAAFLQRMIKGRHVTILLDTDGWYRPLLPVKEHTLFKLKTLYKTLGYVPAFVLVARGDRRDTRGNLAEHFVNRAMIENGLALVDRRYRFRREEDKASFNRYEAFARERRLGLWR